MKTLAIIGGGIAGLGTAWFLRNDYAVTVFDAGSHLGGHSNTVVLEEQGREIAVDTGFMVFNPVTYPNLVRLFGHLGVPTAKTDMSFSVQHRPRGLEYCGSSLNRLFAQRSNLLRPSFLGMLRSILRFNREALVRLEDPALHTLTLGEYVRQGRYGDAFLNWYLIPMCSAVWSTPPEEMLRFPAASLLRFFHNHGFLGHDTHHQWWTVSGGSRTYVARLAEPFKDRIRRGETVLSVRRTPGEGVRVRTALAEQHFDKVVFATHPPSTLQLLGAGATEAERRILSCFRYQRNLTTLHTDRSVMPRRRAAWASWNYRYDKAALGDGESEVSTHYWMNSLQSLPTTTDYFVSVNGRALIRPSSILRTFEYEHPLFDLAAVAAQRELPGLNALARGGSETYFAGAWQRYGFHEDGLLSAVALAGLLLGRDPWGDRP